ncbi:MAG: cytochrome c [Chthoniobacterales bacterium]|nr:cytochrome c [Chthoniobacterales bacterium]
MLKGFFLTFLLLGVAMVAILGFRGSTSTAPPIEIFPDMVRQPKVRPQAPLSFFVDNRGMRPPVPGTVPLGYEMPQPQSPANVGVPPAAAGLDPAVVHDLAFGGGAGYANTGKMGGNWGNGIPLPVTPQFMERGAERFNINCAICHGATGAGDGIVKQYGMATIVSIIDDRIANMSDGEIFNTITHGKNTMLSYGGTVTVNDRWAIIAYLRALQRRERATAADIPPEARIELEKQ